MGNDGLTGDQPRTLSQDELISMWEKTVDVQMHFNDLQLRIRNFAILIVSAFVGGFGVALKENFSVELHGTTIPVASLLFFFAALIWLAFYLMDTLWYHPLLMGAVEHGRLLEAEMQRLNGLTGLTETIKKNSPTKILGFEVHSKHKARVFYFSVFAALLLMSVLLLSARTGVANVRPTNAPALNSGLPAASMPGTAAAAASAGRGVNNPTQPKSP